MTVVTAAEAVPGSVPGPITSTATIAAAELESGAVAFNATGTALMPLDEPVTTAGITSTKSWTHSWSWSAWYKSLARAAQVASHLPQMSIMLAAVKAAEVGGPLSDSSTEWTILVPLNDAFEDLLEQLNLTPAQLLANKPLLQKVLSYHVIPAAALRSNQLAIGPYATALTGASVTIKRRSSGALRIQGGSSTNLAKVLVSNIKAGKSIIHIIDEVLVPPS